MIISPNQVDIETALRTFLLAILPDGIEVVTGQDNRVPEPDVDNFVVMWPIRRTRLDTNNDEFADVVFTADIAGSILTVTAIAHGRIEVGATVFGVDVDSGTTILSFNSGSGGIGTYNLNKSKIIPSGKIACGAINTMQAVEVVVQLDVHGSLSPDNAQIISTLLRDQYGVSAIQAINSAITPLHADDPRQMPFINAEQQYETRWIVEAHLQVNQTIKVPQQFADEVRIARVAVDEFIPPLPGPGTDASLDYSDPDNSMYQPGLI